MKSNIQKINLTGQKGITAEIEALADRQHQYSEFQKVLYSLDEQSPYSEYLNAAV